MNKININELIVGKSYYIIYKENNLIINLGKLYDFTNVQKTSLPWGSNDGPEYMTIGYILKFPFCKYTIITNFLAFISLEEYNNFIKEYDGFYELD